ncbi:MAG: adenylosuccinate lyase [Alphaproteobacteria bacterium]
MIPRYARPEMVEIWQPATKFKNWFLIEAHACDKMAALGIIPADAAAAIWQKGDQPYSQQRIDRIDEIEAVTRHDVIAFLTELSEQVGEEARFMHQGLTSSDVLDTCLAMQLNAASDLLLKAMDLLLEALKRRAVEHKLTPTIGRSHAIHAEPTSFGLKLAGHYAAFKRCKKRLEAARDEIATCAISGAVGTFANVPPQIEAYVANKLGLAVEPISTQIIPRDRHAAFFAALGVIASQIEDLAVEIRHLQRSELREAEEFFNKGQKGSSAMPHKRNPVLSENLTGLARLVRSAVTPALENVALWHERDISHSAVERGIAPDATIHLDFALHRLTGLIDKLVVYPDQMLNNLNAQMGLHNSQRVMLALTQKGVTREDSYALVQTRAMDCWHNQIDFKQALLQDSQIGKYLSADEIETLTNLDYHFTHIDEIFARVFDA